MLCYLFIFFFFLSYGNMLWVSSVLKFSRYRDLLPLPLELISPLVAYALHIFSTPLYFHVCTKFMNIICRTEYREAVTSWPSQLMYSSVKYCLPYCRCIVLNNHYLNLICLCANTERSSNLDQCPLLHHIFECTTH